jgi:hypothetical protein
MISLKLRLILVLLAIGFGASGAMMFLSPVWAGEHFTWSVSPFAAMTIGGWCLGNAWAAGIVVQRRRWPTMLGPIVYLALFGLLQVAVLAAFRPLLQSGPLATLYMVTTFLTALFAIAAFVEGVRRDDIWQSAEPAIVTPAVWTIAILIALTGGLGLSGLIAIAGARDVYSAIFPEPLIPLSLRAFGAFYLALAASAAPLVVTRNRCALRSYLFAIYPLLLLITVSAIVFIGQFDFSNRPGQIIYLGLYVIAAGLSGFVLVVAGTGARAS